MGLNLTPLPFRFLVASHLLAVTVGIFRHAFPMTSAVMAATTIGIMAFFGFFAPIRTTSSSIALQLLKTIEVQLNAWTVAIVGVSSFSFLIDSSMITNQ